MSESASYVEDWRFHQATGMVAAQVGINDMTEAAIQLIARAKTIGYTPHEAAVLVIDGQVWFD